MIQAREFERLGGTKTIRANVRLITATHKDIESAIRDGSFREDLYYRLNVFAIFLPPLRERKPDLLLLADHFLEKASLAHGKHIKRISTPAIDMLMAYHWPGNVRELENAIERAVVVCDGQVVHAHHLPPTLQTAASSGTSMSLSLKDALDAYEKDLIQDALKTVARQSREGGAPAQHDRAHHELQGAPSRHRLAPVQEVTKTRPCDTRPTTLSALACAAAKKCEKPCASPSDVKKRESDTNVGVHGKSHVLV